MSIASVATPRTFADVSARAESVNVWSPRPPVIDQQTDGKAVIGYAYVIDEDLQQMSSADTTKGGLLLTDTLARSNGSVVWATAGYRVPGGATIIECDGKYALKIFYGNAPATDTVSTVSPVAAAAVRIQQLAKLSSRNDSTPVSEDTEQVAIQILGLLPKDLPLPQPTVSEDGEIILSWYGPNGRVEMFIDPSLHIVSFGRFESGFIDGDDVEWSRTLPPKTVDLVRRAYL